MKSHERRGGAFMPFTVLKISKIVEGRVEVAGEFADEAEAQKFVDSEQLNNAQEYEFSVEPPPLATNDPS